MKLEKECRRFIRDLRAQACLQQVVLPNVGPLAGNIPLTLYVRGNMEMITKLNTQASIIETRHKEFLTSWGVLHSAVQRHVKEEQEVGSAATLV